MYTHSTLYHVSTRGLISERLKLRGRRIIAVRFACVAVGAEELTNRHLVVQEHAYQREHGRIGDVVHTLTLRKNTE